MCTVYSKLLLLVLKGCLLLRYRLPLLSYSSPRIVLVHIPPTYTVVTCSASWVPPLTLQSARGALETAGVVGELQEAPHPPVTLVQFPGWPMR